MVIGRCAIFHAALLVGVFTLTVAPARSQTPPFGPGPRQLTQAQATKMCELGLKYPDPTKDLKAWMAAVKDCAKFMRADSVVIPDAGTRL